MYGGHLHASRDFTPQIQCFAGYYPGKDADMLISLGS